MADKRHRIEWLPDTETETEEALVKILVRLPVDDLARYKLVCKDWCRLISSPDFVSLHLERSKSDPLSHQILVHASPFRSIVQGPLNSVICCSSPTTVLIGSVNGLVCFAGNNLFNGATPVDHIWILNPVTGQAGKLPPPTSPFDTRGYDKATLAFWWDSDSIITGGYKVFKICSISSANYVKAWKSSDPGMLCRPIESNTLEVWDSSSPDSWSGVDMGFNHPCPPFHHLGGPVTSCDVAVGGFAYWIVIDGDGCDSFVFSLDMKTHTVRPISFPQLLTPTNILIRNFFVKENLLLFLANWKGEICLVEQEKGPVSGFPYYNVWTVVVDGSDYSWIKNWSFRLDFIPKKCVNNINGKLLLQLDINGRMILGDMENQPVLGGSVCDMETQPVLGSSGHVDMETQFKNNAIVDWGDWDLFCTWFAKKEKGYPLSFNQYKTYIELQTDEEDSDFDRISVASAHDFVGSLLSIEGFKPLQDYGNYPYFYVTWPNLGTSGRVGNWNTNEEQSEKETHESAWANEEQSEKETHESAWA